MIAFGRTTWNSEIGQVSEDEEFQKALIRIEDPNEDRGEYNVVTGKWTFEGVDRTLYRGRARVKEIRWGVYQKGEPVANPSDRKSIRVQVPRKDFPDRLVTGTKIFIETADENPSLESRVVVVTNSVQGSSPASRTYDCAMDADGVIPNGV